MKAASIALAAGACVAGLWASLKWFKASGRPTWDTLDTSADQNRRAALWTAVSIGLSGLSVLTSALL